MKYDISNPDTWFVTKHHDFGKNACIDTQIHVIMSRAVRKVAELMVNDSVLNDIFISTSTVMPWSKIYDNDSSVVMVTKLIKMISSSNNILSDDTIDKINDIIYRGNIILLSVIDSIIKPNVKYTTVCVDEDDKVFIRNYYNENDFLVIELDESMYTEDNAIEMMNRIHEYEKDLVIRSGQEIVDQLILHKDSYIANAAKELMHKYDSLYLDKERFMNRLEMHDYNYLNHYKLATNVTNEYMKEIKSCRYDYYPGYWTFIMYPTEGCLPNKMSDILFQHRMESLKFEPSKMELYSILHMLAVWNMEVSCRDGFKYDPVKIKYKLDQEIKRGLKDIMHPDSFMTLEYIISELNKYYISEGNGHGNE